MKQIEIDKNGNVHVVQDSKKPIMEDCVNCGKETEYPINMNIDYRSYYVEGAGQLCKECYDKIYLK